MHHYRHPCGAGVVDDTRPETAHGDSAVIDRVRQHVSVLDSDERLGVGGERFAPRPYQIKNWTEMFRFPEE